MKRGRKRLLDVGDIVGITTLVERSGLTYRQLDRYARDGIFLPSLVESAGKGSRRIYTRRDLLIACLLGELSTMGTPMKAVTLIASALKEILLDCSDLALLREDMTVISTMYRTRLLSTKQLLEYIHELEEPTWVVPWKVVLSKAVQ